MSPSKVAKLAQAFVQKAMKLPLESRPMSGPIAPVPDVPVDTSTIDLKSFPELEKKEPPAASGFIVDGLEGVRAASSSFVIANQEYLRSPNKTMYVEMFKSLNNAISIAAPLVRKSNPNDADLQQLEYVANVIFYAFDRLNGSGFDYLPGYDAMMQSMYYYGPALQRFVFKRQEFPSGKNPWKKYDPDNADLY